MNEDVNGAYRSGESCIVEAADPTSGVYAIARCCDFTNYAIDCQHEQSDISTTGNDHGTNVRCSDFWSNAYPTLIGCFGNDDGGLALDGAYPEGHPWDFGGVKTIIRDVNSGDKWYVYNLF